MAKAASKNAKVKDLKASAEAKTGQKLSKLFVVQKQARTLLKRILFTKIV